VRARSHKIDVAQLDLVPWVGDHSSSVVWLDVAVMGVCVNVNVCVRVWVYVCGLKRTSICVAVRTRREAESFRS
jgi:hypothetical protein